MFNSILEQIQNTLSPKIISTSSEAVFKKNIILYFIPLFTLPVFLLLPNYFENLLYLIVVVWLFKYKYINIGMLITVLVFTYCNFISNELQGLFIWNKGIILLSFIFAGVFFGFISALMFSLPDIISLIQNQKLLENTFVFQINNLYFQIALLISVVAFLGLLFIWISGYINNLYHQNRNLELKLKTNQKYLTLGYLSNTFASEVEKSVEKLHYLISSLTVHIQNLNYAQRLALMKRVDVMNRQIVRIENLDHQLSFNPNFSNLEITHTTGINKIVDSVLALSNEKIKTLGIRVYKIIDENLNIENGGLILCQSLVPIIENALDSIASNPFKTTEGNWLRIKVEIVSDYLTLTVVNSGDPVSDDHWSSQFNLAYSEIEGVGKNQNIFLVEKLIENLGGKFNFFKLENHGAFRWTLPISLFEKSKKRNENLIFVDKLNDRDIGVSL